MMALHEHSNSPAGRQTLSGTREPSHRLVDAKEVARTLGCSWRTVLRLADAGIIPWGVKLGALRRWNLDDIEQFITSGCKPVRKGGR
jgi:excisionase family DNA binding protein